jgi:ER lumen protein retaining receptor
MILLVFPVGISVKTQELRLLVFCTRYVDLFYSFYSVYNSIVKIVYIVATAVIIFRIKYSEPIKSLYNKSQDSFPHWKYAVAPCAILALLIHVSGSSIHDFSLMELLWTFSIILESVAILPQLLVLQKYRLVENLTGKFVFFLGLYRLLYIVNWIHRAHTERNFRHHPLVYVCGVVQTLLYADFFYQYSKALHCCRQREARRDGDDDDDTTSLLFEISQQPRRAEDATTRKGRSIMTGGVSDEPLLAAMTVGTSDESILMAVEEQDTTEEEN